MVPVQRAHTAALVEVQDISPACSRAGVRQAGVRVKGVSRGGTTPQGSGGCPTEEHCKLSKQIAPERSAHHRKISGFM